MRKEWMLSYLLLFGLILTLPDAVWAVDLKEGVEQLATQLAKSVLEGKQLRVAVTDFPDIGPQEVVSDLGRYIAERLTTRLSQDPKFWVIERRRLGQVLGELRFSMSDLVDPEKAKQLGKMVGVEAIVVGSISDLGNQVDLDARMIEIETGKTLPGAAVTISKDQVVAGLLARGRVAAAPSPRVPGLPAQVPSAPPPTPPAVPPEAPSRPIVITEDQWRIEVERGEIVGNQLTLHVKVENLQNNPRNVGICQDTYLVAEGIPYGLTQGLDLRDVRPQIFRRGKFALAIPPNFLELETVALIVKGGSTTVAHYNPCGERRWEVTLPRVALKALLGREASAR